MAGKRITGQETMIDNDDPPCAPPQVFSGGLSSYSTAVMAMAHLQAEGVASTAAAAAAPPGLEGAVDLRASAAAAAADVGQLLHRFLTRFGSEFRCAGLQRRPLESMLFKTAICGRRRRWAAAGPHLSTLWLRVQVRQALHRVLPKQIGPTRSGKQQPRECCWSAERACRLASE